MKIIKEPDKGIVKILGRQKIKDTEYKRALWVIEDGNLVHNTLTGEVLELTEDERLPAGAETIADTGEFIARRYLVPAALDEIGFIKQYRRVLQLALLPGLKGGYTILPTTACNARCFYCYEKGIEFHTMSDEIVQQVIEKIAAEQEEKASLHWFGGEPLVGMKQIDAICLGLKDRGLEVSSHMISNGYLFDEQVVRKAVELWHLQDVQITLDGTEEIYNSVKSYVNPGENPFRRVIRNITLLTEAGVRVVVRLNVGQHNYEDLKNLIPELETIRHNNFSVYARTLFQEQSEENDIRCAELMDLLAEKGLRRKGRALSRMRMNACMADNVNSVIIDPLGGLSKCEHYIFNGRVGSLAEGVDKEKLKRWKQYTIPAPCVTCPLVPSCILLNDCPGGTPCSNFERNQRIKDTILSMHMVQEKKERQAAKETEEDADSEAAEPIC